MKPRKPVQDTAAETPTERYDELTLGLEKAEALAGHLKERLWALDEDDTEGHTPELFPLSIIAEEVCGKAAERPRARAGAPRRGVPAPERGQP